MEVHPKESDQTGEMSGNMSCEECVCHFMFRKVMMLSRKDAPCPCRAMITSFNYSKSCHVELGFYIFWISRGQNLDQCVTDTRRLVSTACKHSYPIVWVFVSAPFSYHWSCTGDPCQQKPVSPHWMGDSLDGPSYLRLQDGVIICH